MFEAGNVVRVLTENGNGDILHVKNDSDENTGITEVTNADGMVVGYDTKDLELVTDSQEIHISTPMNPQIPHLRTDDLHTEINKYYVSLINRAREQGYDGTLYLKINAMAYAGDTETKIDYIASCDYEDSVVSGDLTFSVDTAVRRHLENKEMKVPAIPHYK